MFAYGWQEKCSQAVAVEKPRLEHQINIPKIHQPIKTSFIFNWGVVKKEAVRCFKLNFINFSAVCFDRKEKLKPRQPV
jgi:hypothetical protein